MADRVHRITSMGSDAPSESPTAEGGPQPGQAPGGAAFDDGRAYGLERTIDRVLAIQRPVVLAHLRGIRRRYPAATPEDLVRILEKRYLAAVTTGGAAVGATAVIPGITTGVTLALSGVETAGFLEATALFAQSTAEVHGIPVENPDRARALVMTLMLGQEGSDLVRQFASQATGAGVARNVYWGELITNTLPKAVVGTVADSLRRTFVKQFAVRGGGSFIGKALPFGIGAAIGGVGNHVLGRRVLTQSRLAFGPPPATVPLDLEPREGGGMIAGAAGATGRGLVRAGSVVGRAVTAPARRLRALGAARRGAPDAPDETDAAGGADAVSGTDASVVDPGAGPTDPTERTDPTDPPRRG
ncbi:hypothetical protein ACGGZK_11200 [Agromyces sp. MMS24-K17]|uniref:hypothetical protein n=1 Tax=Agromyces sp. MMS24-K17 TaxID=3372850 RepID=UPI0037553A26